MKVVSLYSGCGGLDFGFISEGYEIIWANDILQDACNTYAMNFGDHIVCEDIKKVDKSTIPKADLVIGGPPCQSFSLVGKRDPNDERSSLVFDYLEVLEHVKPKIFLFENVTGISSAKDSEGNLVLNNLKMAFSEIGYTISIYKLNAADYGVPQRRQRVFLIGSKDGVEITAPIPTHSQNGDGKHVWVSSLEALDDLGNPCDSGESKYAKEPEGEFQCFMRANDSEVVTQHFTPYASEKDKELMQYIPPGGNYTSVPDHVATTRILNFKKTGGRTTTYGRLDPKMPSYTINTHFNRLNVGCNIHYRDRRIISIREGLRLQSFPDSFFLTSKTKRNFYVQVGNAVPPLLAKAWAKHLKGYFN